MKIYAASRDWLAVYHIQGEHFKYNVAPIVMTRVIDIGNRGNLVGTLTALYHGLSQYAIIYRRDRGMSSRVVKRWKFDADVEIILDNEKAKQLLEKPDDTMAGVLAKQVLNILEEARWTVKVDVDVARKETLLFKARESYGAR